MKIGAHTPLKLVVYLQTTSRISTALCARAAGSPTGGAVTANM